MSKDTTSNQVTGTKWYVLQNQRLRIVITYSSSEPDKFSGRLKFQANYAKRNGVTNALLTCDSIKSLTHAHFQDMGMSIAETSKNVETLC